MTSNNDTQAPKTSQPGTIVDAGLSMLRDQVKNIMIPLLIKVFHLKLEAQQASSPPSRLKTSEPEGKVLEVCQQLENLDEDLKLMIGWCQSSRHQIQKVLVEIQEELKPPSAISGFFGDTNPNVQKSFIDALASQKEYIKKIKDMQKRDTSLSHDSAQYQQKPPPSWWTRIFKH